MLYEFFLHSTCSKTYDSASLKNVTTPLKFVGFLCSRFASSDEGAAHSDVHQDPEMYSTAELFINQNI